MAEILDLTGDIALAIDGARERGNPLVVGYTGDDGTAQVSLRGSTQVYGPQQLALWVRNSTAGLAMALPVRPVVSFLYYGFGGPDPIYLWMRGRGRIDETASDTVYARMAEVERGKDPDARGVAVIVDVERLVGFREADGRFYMELDPGASTPELIGSREVGSQPPNSARQR